MRIPTLQKTLDKIKKKEHYLHVCVFFVTEIPARKKERKGKRESCMRFFECIHFIQSVLGNLSCSDGEKW